MDTQDRPLPIADGISAMYPPERAAYLKGLTDLGDRDLPFVSTCLAICCGAFEWIPAGCVEGGW